MNTLDILATLLAQILLNKLGLSTYHLTAVVPLIAALLGYLSTNQSFTTWFQMQDINKLFEITEWLPSTATMWWCVILGLGGWLIIRWFHNQFILIELNRRSSVEKLISYITLNKEKFSRFPSMSNADPNILVYNSLEITNEFTNNLMKPGQTIYFWNTLFGTGYFTTHLRYITCERNPSSSSGTRANGDYDDTTTQTASRYSSVRIPVYSCQLYVLRGSVNPSIFENLDNILDNDNTLRSREAPFIKLVNYKIHTNQNKRKMMPISIVEHTVYQGRNRSLAELEPIYMDTHFHMEKNRLWSLIKEIDQNKDYYRRYGQTPKLNLLLHGPPGTGKSSFAYRVAMTLRRDIISMDLTKYPNKYIIDKLMHGYINLWLSNTSILNPNKLVYVFDEFDRTIEFLIAAQEKEKRVFESKLKSMSAGIGLSALLGNSASNKSKLARKGNLGSDSDYEEDDFTITSGNDPTSGEPSTEFASQLLTIKDLLEIFQGVVDVDGRLIFAMTNHFDKIKQECPALFRPGRLTPVYFGYINRDTLVDIIGYYFNDISSVSGDELNKLPDEFQISTSEIIEQAIYFSATPKNGLPQFIDWLGKRCAS